MDIILKYFFMLRIWRCILLLGVCPFAGSFITLATWSRVLTVNVLKIRTPKFLTKMTYANSAGPDQTAPEGAV